MGPSVLQLNIDDNGDLSQGLFHPHDLLHNVWQQNFHEYSEYAPTSLLNFPLADHHLGELRGVVKKSFLWSG